MMKTIHPFPARMSADIALDKLANYRNPIHVLDPMAGSGTVIRHAIESRHHATGFDMDPLAVMMAQVWNTPVSATSVDFVLQKVLHTASSIDPYEEQLPWIDEDEETTKFIEYWFGKKQIPALRSIAFAMDQWDQLLTPKHKPALNLIKIALSRIIITKERCASLARDTSHSRPHRVATDSDYQVFPAFELSVQALLKRLAAHPPPKRAKIKMGDARSLKNIKDETMDLVLTSPPYLNAIDYLRGHRLSLVWLGWKLSKIRRIRSNSIGAERLPDNKNKRELFAEIYTAMGEIEKLPARYPAIVDRYAEDLYRILAETARVLKSDGMAIFVIGNSCIRGISVNNSEGLKKAAEIAGLVLQDETERELPLQRRYLPFTKSGKLGKRMRTETVCSFTK